MQEDNSSPVVPVATSPVVIEQPKQNNFIVILLSVLLLFAVSIAGFFGFQTQKLVKELTLLRSEPTPVPTVEPTFQPVATNIVSATSDPTANWKTYSNIDFSYKYPTDWKEGQGRQTVVSNIAGANITNFSKDMPMYNECMKLDKTDIKNGLMVKYYTYASSGEMCTNQANINNKEIWITKAGGDGFQPGLIYYHNEVIYPRSTNIFGQILSTFKFIN